MHIDTDQLVFEAILLDRLTLLFFSLLFLLELIFSEHFLIVLLLKFILLRLLLNLFLLFKEALFAHDLEVRVWLEVEHGRELAESVDLVCLKRLKVEANALQVHNENIWRLCNQCAS